MFTAGVFTTARTRKKPKSSLRDKWIRKMWYIYIYNGILPTHKNETKLGHL